MITITSNRNSKNPLAKNLLINTFLGNTYELKHRLLKMATNADTVLQSALLNGISDNVISYISLSVLGNEL